MIHADVHCSIKTEIISEIVIGSWTIWDKIFWCTLQGRWSYYLGPSGVLWEPHICCRIICSWLRHLVVRVFCSPRSIWVSHTRDHSERFWRRSMIQSRRNQKRSWTLEAEYAIHVHTTPSFLQTRKMKSFHLNTALFLNIPISSWL